MTLKFPEGHKGLIKTIQYALPHCNDMTYYQSAVFIADRIKEWENDPTKIPGTIYRKQEEEPETKIKYKCTYTALEGAACPVMGRYKFPHPSHCHAYDTTIWKINPKIKCKNCIPLKSGEKPKKKIWCDQMSMCDSYNDGGSKECEDCIAGDVVFDVPELKEDNR